MSIVGPRPLAVIYLDYYNDEEKKRHDCIEFIKSNPKVKEKEGKQKKILYKFPRLTKIVRSVRHIKDYVKAAGISCV